MLSNFRYFVVWVLDSQSRASAGGLAGSRMLRARSCGGVAPSATPKDEAPPLPQSSPLQGARPLSPSHVPGKPLSAPPPEGASLRRALTKGACAGGCHMTRRRCAGGRWILKLLVRAGRACPEVSRPDCWTRAAVVPANGGAGEVRGNPTEWRLGGCGQS